MTSDAVRSQAERPTSGERPAVSVVMPFAGSEAEARAALESLLSIRRRDDDEIIVVDNSGSGSVPERDGVRVLRADEERSAYYSRNVGAESARNPWMLLVDSDCRPRPDILDRYFDEPVADEVGAVVGEVEGEPGQNALVSRYARSRGHLGQLTHWTYGFRPWGVTANLLVRRDAWASVGGFLEGIRSAGDTEFSWRLQEAEWKLAYQPQAVVEHHHRDSLRKLVRQAARYGAGRAWVSRRYPGALQYRSLLRELGRSVAGVLVWTVTGRFERGAFKALDGLYELSKRTASLLSNTPPGPRPARARASLAAIAGAFPALDDQDAVSRVRELGASVPVEALARPVRVDRAAVRSLPIAWLEDDGALRRVGAVAWLVSRHPVRVARYALRTPRGVARPRLADLAPRARRLAALGASEIRVVDRGSQADADALAEVLGVAVR